MSMSRKNYEAVAKILAVAPQGNAEEYRLAIARILSNYFAADNENFDEARFLAACNA